MTQDEAIQLLNADPITWTRRRMHGADVCLDLSGADLSDVDLNGAGLRDAILVDANLFGANLRGADLRGADLSRADLCEAKLIGTSLSRADLSNAVFGVTVLASDLSGARGLERTHHAAASPISVDSILSFKDELPEKFLRGCGLQDEEIAYFRSRVGQTVRFYSCFISYSTADEEFATRLHNDFQAAGIRCWKWDHDARTGQSLWGEIDQAIRVHDKLVLIASESSLKSPAVNREIERAIRKEDLRATQKAKGDFDGDVNVLFPVRVDDFIFHGWEHERKIDVTKKVIADARKWESDPAVYARVRDRLIQDLPPESRATE